MQRKPVPVPATALDGLEGLTLRAGLVKLMERSEVRRLAARVAPEGAQVRFVRASGEVTDEGTVAALLADGGRAELLPITRAQARRVVRRAMTEGGRA